LTERQAYGLLLAYIRRKRREGQLLAAGALQLLAEAKGQSSGGQASLSQLQALGIEVVGGDHAG
jgi:hypothetical protein